MLNAWGSEMPKRVKDKQADLDSRLDNRNTLTILTNGFVYAAHYTRSGGPRTPSPLLV
jgi:hypothetical protein